MSGKIVRLTQDQKIKLGLNCLRKIVYSNGYASYHDPSELFSLGECLIFDLSRRKRGVIWSEPFISTCIRNKFRDELRQDTLHAGINKSLQKTSLIRSVYRERGRAEAQFIALQVDDLKIVRRCYRK